MNLLIDMSAIKTGGGLQLAINFIDYLRHHEFTEVTIHILVVKDGVLHKYITNNHKYSVVIGPNNKLIRIFFENIILYKYLIRNNIQYIYTFFGPGLPHPNTVHSVVSVAYPIICYPESMYWKTVDLKTKIYKNIINYFRLRRLRQADKILAETEIMRGRLAKTIPFNKKNIVTIPPTPSKYINAVSSRKYDGNIRLLFLSGVDHHKNLWLLPFLAAKFYEHKIKNIRFIISTSEETYLNKQNNKARTQYYQHREYFEFIGNIKPMDIQKAYDQADYLVLLSDLESFSNNYMEAWKAGIPLIVSDRDFSRYICGSSAIYIEPHDLNATFSVLSDVMLGNDIRDVLIKAGKERLRILPDEYARFNKIMAEIIELPGQLYA